MQNSDSYRIDWHTPQWRQILEGAGPGLARLPHALLLLGAGGVGKEAFGEQLARLLLCESPVGRGELLAPCGECEACHWMAGESHPDFRRLAPDGESDEEEAEAKPAKKRGAGQIKVDAIRALDDFVFVGSHRNGRRVVLIQRADAMNLVAANALLKMLEEPPATVYFILVTSHPKRLLATIRSRTRAILFRRPEGAEAAAWLKARGLSAAALAALPLAGGAPLTLERWEQEGHLAPLQESLAALEKSPGDPVQLAGQWDGVLKRHPTFQLELLVDGLQRRIHDLVLAAGGLPPRYRAEGKGFSAGGPADRLLALWRELLRFRRSARHPLNQQLFLEDLAIQVARGLRPVEG